MHTLCLLLLLFVRMWKWWIFHFFFQSLITAFSALGYTILFKKKNKLNKTLFCWLSLVIKPSRGKQKNTSKNKTFHEEWLGWNECAILFPDWSKLVFRFECCKVLQESSFLLFLIFWILIDIKIVVIAWKVTCFYFHSSNKKKSLSYTER